MTPEEIARLTALAEAATKGEWRVTPCSHGGMILHRGPAEPREARHPQGQLQIVPETDAAYIAAVHPETLLRLLGELTRLREREQQQEQEIETLLQTPGAVKAIEIQERETEALEILRIIASGECSDPDNCPKPWHCGRCMAAEFVEKWR